MNVFDAGDELIRQQQHRLQGEFAVAKIEKILQTWSEKIKDHGVVITFCSKPADKRNTDSTGKGLVDTGFIFELRMLCLDTLQFDGDFFAGYDVST